MKIETVSSNMETEVNYSSWKFKSYGQLAIFLPDDLTTVQVQVPRKHKTRKSVERLVDVTMLSTEDELELVETVAQTRKPQPKTTVCSECGKMIKTRSYERHMKSHQYKCNLCWESFSSDQTLAAHMDLHQKNRYPCEICGISFKDPLMFAFHLQKHSAFGIFKCPICPFETTTRSSLRPHIKIHNNDFKCICEICGRGFLSAAAHADHLKLHEGGKQFKCEHCEKTFNLQRYLIIHQKLNHKDILLGREEWFTCEVCDRKFKFEKSLARHLSCIHNIGESRKVPCPICAKVIANNYNLKVHMRLHNGERPYTCDVCQMGFARYKYLKKHKLPAGALVVLAEVDEAEDNWGEQLPEIEIIRVETDGTLVLMNKDEILGPKETTVAESPKPPPIGYVNPFNYENLPPARNFQGVNLRWPCVICSEVADDKDDLIEHYEKHKREKDEALREAKVQPKKQAAAALRRSDPPPNKTICPECGKMIRTRAYDRHMKSHQFKCGSCCESFSSSQLLTAHMDLHQNNTYPCETCGISFKDPLKFTFHNEKHSALGIFKCPICPFKTTTKTSLRPHIKLHNNDFRCICEICGKGFLSFAAHADHLKLHEGGKEFKCEYCEKTFNLQRYLILHQKFNHKDILLGREEWFTCDVCDRKFKFETSLARHRSCIHNIGESRKVPCPVCGKVIANNYNLKVHMRVHNGEKPYSCDVCQMGFATYKYLKKHKLRKHKN